MHDLNFIVVKVGSSSSRKLNNRPHHNIEYTHTSRRSRRGSHMIDLDFIVVSVLARKKNINRLVVRVNIQKVR